MTSVWIYERETDTIKVFASEAAAEAWLKENDPEGVAFKFEVMGEQNETTT